MQNNNPEVNKMIDDLSSTKGITKENYIRALNESPVPMILHVEDGEFLLMNKACLDITGYEFAEVNTIEKWMTAVHRERKDYNKEFVKSNYENGILLQGEEEIVYTKSGEERVWAFHNSHIGKLEDGRNAIITVGVDVTEQHRIKIQEKKILEELSDTKTLLEASLESPRDMIILSFDKEYKYLYFNKGHKNTMKQLYNVDVEIGKNILDCIIIEEDRRREKINYDRALSGESHSIIEQYGEQHNLYFETFYNPIINSKGVIIGASVFSHEITNRIHEIERIKESEEKFRLIYSSMSQGLAVHDIILDKTNKPIDYRFVEINDSYQKLFGYKREDVIGKRIKEVAPQLEDYWIEVFGKVALTGEPCYYENYSKSADKYFSTYAYSPKFGQFAVLISDITNRIKREEEIKYLSYNDQLTGVYNRRYYEEQFEKLDIKENLPLSLIMGDVNGLKLVNDSFGHLVGDELLKKVAVILQKACRASDIVTRIGGDEFVIFLPKTSKVSTERIIERINKFTSKEKVNAIDISISFGYGTKTKIEEPLIKIFKEVEDAMYRAKLNEGSSMRSKTIDLIITTLYEKNEREMHHSQRVSNLCERFGKEIGLDKESVKQLKTGGLMHDIGKIGIKEVTLNKKSKLNDEEWIEVKKHSEIGYRILSSLNEFSDIANNVLEHHERWDGKGYPKGLKGEDVNLQARIIGLCDAFDAMTGPRSYRSRLTKDMAIKELIKGAGTQFDPTLVEIFIERVLKEEV